MERAGGSFLGKLAIPVHDWTLLEAGIYDAFHTSWNSQIQDFLNAGLLPEGYHFLAEQHAGRVITDILTLPTSSPLPQRPMPWPLDTGGTAPAEARPRVRCRRTAEPAAARRRQSVAICHFSGRRLVALVEIVLPAN